MRFLALVVLFAATAFAGTFKLYLKDGDYHSVREYQLLGDRIRYYSTERGDWEEIPKELVDLNRTETERRKSEEALKQSARLDDEEEKAEREQRRLIERIPMNPGVYVLEGAELKTLKAAESTLVTDKKRNVLKSISPVPVVAGKATVTIRGEHASFVVAQDRPEFYIRLSSPERFAIIQLTPKKDIRVVENVSIMPVTKENVEDQRRVETFTQELMGGLFKIWPEKPLAPGEYALIEFSEGELNQQVWDFAYRPSAAVAGPATRKTAANE